MVDAALAEPPPPGPSKVRLRSDWRWRLLNELFALFIALLFLLAVLLVLLDSAPGHRFIVDQIGKFETASGLRVRIGRIDGSIFGKSQLRNVAIADPKTGKATRVRFEERDGKKVRVAAKSGELIHG